MAKKNTTESFEDQKEKLFDALEELQESLNLSDEEVRIVKDWGVTLLIAGVSVFVIYRVIKKLFGNKKAASVKKAKSSGKGVHTGEISPAVRMIREQLTLFLLAFIKQKLNQFLESKGLLHEERDS